MTGLTCLVLGGCGFVGSAIAAEGQARGYTVHVVGKEEYDAAVGTQCDLLINANGNSRKYLARKNPAQEFDLSVRSVLRSLHDFSAARYIYLSTMDVYPDASDPALNGEETVIDATRQSPYGLHKHLAEQTVRYYAPRWLIFRMAGFVGPGLWKNSIFDLLNGQPLRVHPDSTYQYLHTRDLARAVFRICETGTDHEIFNIAGQGLISLREVAAMLPDCRPAFAGDEVPRERYELNVAKLGRLYPLPQTRDTIHAFLEEWRNSPPPPPDGQHP